MDYSDIHFDRLNIPPLESLADGRCCRRYLYSFANLLPEQNTMNLLVKQFEQKFTFSKEAYELIEDVVLYAWVTTERLSDYEAIFTVSTNEPEESYFYLWGIRSLPIKIEQCFGIVESIQGDAKKSWIKPNCDY